MTTLDLADTPYAVHSKDMMKLDRKLRTLGAATVLSMPSICVIGKQSVGKSSLVEALSGIKVPRDRDTTTRCPVEVRMTTSSEPWNCQISLRRRFWLSGSKLREQVFGGRLSLTDDVELMLRRAQLAILNPLFPFEKCLDLTWSQVRGEEACEGLQTGKDMFSEDVICVDVAGPSVMNLTFVDLPGVINTTDLGLVKRVEDLVASHIEQPNALILVVMAMNDEVTNQKADGLAKKVDPDGRRTIGVLTKADMISSSGEFKTCEFWLDVVEGRKLPLCHGYYVTRQPNEKELHDSITNEDARRREMEFFRKNSPWNTSVVLETRFGTHKLAEALSELLISMMQTNLPFLEKTVRAGLDQCRNDFASLPPTPSTDHLTTMFSLVQSFSTAALQTVVGSPQHPELVQDNMKLYRTMKLVVKKTAPNFQPWTNEAEYNRLKTWTADITEPFWVDVRDNVADDEASSDLDDLRKFSKLLSSRHMYLEDVRERIQRATTRELKGNVPFSVKASLIAEFAQKWRQPTLDCFLAVCEALERNLMQLIKQHFERFRTLRTVVTRLVQECIRQCQKDAQEILDLVLELEDHPFTQNDYYLTTFKNAWLTKYLATRERIDSISVQHPVIPIPKSDINVSLDSLLQSFSSPVSSKGSPFNFAQLGSPRPAPSLASSTDVPPAFAGFGTVRSTQLPAPSLPPRSTAAPAPSTPQPSSANPDESAKKARIEAEAKEKLQQLGFTEKEIERVLGLKRKSGGSYEVELSIMAEVRAYFQLSSLHFIDTVPKLIDRSFLMKFVSKLAENLLQQLNKDIAESPEYLAKLVSEDSAVEHKRKALLEKKRMFEAAYEEIVQFRI